MFVNEKFAQVNLSVDPSIIKPEDRPVLSLLIKAANFLNAIYLRQVSHYNPQFKQEIEDSQSKRLIESFRIMGGPWDRFDGDKPFYGNIEKPLGAGFYPANLTREEFEKWIQEHPEDAESFKSFVTVLRHQNDSNDLQAIPYSQFYALELRQAANLLKEAANLTQNDSLKTFLNHRADALISNDYAESDGDWIHLDSDIEIVFGPYETYEDRLMGYKATYESFIGYRNPEETKRLQHIADIIEEMQSSLPISDEMKDTRKSGQSSPFVVIDLLSNSGEARVGVQTLAFVLPNDPTVIEKFGTKKVMMKNVQEAKFNAILCPIAERFLSEHALNHVSFDAFFRHTILHETGHSLGPKAVNHSEDTIIHALSDAYAPIEECKADTTSYYLTHWLYQRGELNHQDLEETYATMIAGFFRSMRFGLTQAHAQANAIQLNFFMEQGAIFCDEQGKFDYHLEKLPQAVSKLVETVMNIEYEGNRDKAQEFLKKYAILSPDLEAQLKALNDLPIDIVCEFDADKPEFFDTLP